MNFILAFTPYVSYIHFLTCNSREIEASFRIMESKAEKVQNPILLPLLHPIPYPEAYGELVPAG